MSEEEFENGDEIDSTTITEPDDGFREPESEEEVGCEE